MAGYQVTARIVGVAPRRAPRARDSAHLLASPPEGTPVDLVGRPLEIGLAERWEAIRERWAQTTFFLFDPDSWRH